MKNYLYILCAFLLAFAGCTKDADVEPIAPAPDGNTQVVLTGFSGRGTRTGFGGAEGRTKTLFSVTKAAKTCPTKVYRRIIPSRTTELGKSLPVCGTIVHYPHPSNEYRFNRSDRHGS